MTKSSTNSNPLPFLLKPAGKDYLWGGERLKTLYSKDINMAPLAETWECSTHNDGLSLVASGEYEGLTLRELLLLHPDYTGRVKSENGEIPILIKFIDAKNDLSIQVHPDDEYAALHENGSLGKTEMWYVLDAPRGSRLVYGFNCDMTPEKTISAIEDGTISKFLQYVPISKNDVFVINPGCVHALGAGALVAEIQENSNITYRLYDYDRLDKTGSKRPLHIDKALAVANLKSNENPRQPMRVLRYRPGFASELLFRCKYFQVERFLLNNKAGITLEDKNDSFHVLLCIEGACKVATPCCPEFNLNIHAGECVFVPAGVTQISLAGNAQLLKIEC